MGDQTFILAQIKTVSNCIGGPMAFNEREVFAILSQKLLIKSDGNAQDLKQIMHGLLNSLIKKVNRR